MNATLAQAAPNRVNALIELVPYLLLFMVAVIVLGMAMWYYRYWARSRDSSPDPTWTLQELCDLRTAGKLSEEEYQALRQSVLQRSVDSVQQSKPGQDS